MLAGGFTEAQLAKEFGYKTPRLQFSKKILASTALKVEKFYNQIRFAKTEKPLKTDKPLKSDKFLTDEEKCISHAKQNGKKKSEALECFDFSVNCPNCPFR